MRSLQSSMADLHAAALAASTARTGSDAHDDFYTLLADYQQPQPQFTDIVATCTRRLAQRLPLDLVAAYSRLAALAQWRARQIAD